MLRALSIKLYFTSTQLTSHCPTGIEAPTCGLMPYLDNSKDIAALFEKERPDFVAKSDHIAGILLKMII